MSKNALKMFLTDLVSDAEKWAKFRTDYDQMIDEANLSDHEKTLLRSGPVDELRAYLGLDSSSFPVCVLRPVD